MWCLLYLSCCIGFWFLCFFFFFKQKTAYEISACLVGSEMCIRDSSYYNRNKRFELIKLLENQELLNECGIYFCTGIYFFKLANNKYGQKIIDIRPTAVSYTHLRAHETGRNLVCRLLLEKKKKKKTKRTETERKKKQKPINIKHSTRQKKNQCTNK